MPAQSLDASHPWATLLSFCESRIPNPESRIPIPDSRFPIPDSRRAGSYGGVGGFSGSSAGAG
jgi:hypothetical protein